MQYLAEVQRAVFRVLLKKLRQFHLDAPSFRGVFDTRLPMPPRVPPNARLSSGRRQIETAYPAELALRRPTASAGCWTPH